MHLEDAWVGCSLDPALDAALAPGLCRELIGNGCDIVACPAGRADLLEVIAPICREEDALLLLSGEIPELRECHGILLEGGAAQLGVARAQVGAEAIVGSRVTTPNDAMLALELGVGFLLYSGALPADVVGALPGAIGVPLFVGGAHIPAEVDVGRYRLWVESSLGLDAPAAVRGCSQALGRVL
jgi:hypothetical protein